MIWDITEKEDGLTAEGWLQQRLPQAPAGYLRQLFRKGSIRHEGQPLKAVQTLRQGWSIQLPDSQRLQALYEEGLAAPEILAETDLWVVVNKPSGLPVHPTDSRDGEDLQTRMTRYYQQKRAPFRVAPAHRIDRGTSGACLFGKGRKALSLLGKAFMDRQVQKTYLALISGRLEQPMKLESEVAAKGKLKKAEANVHPVDCSVDSSLVRLQLMTGRTHQLRQQLAQIGLPILGDRRYGTSQGLSADRLCLHSWKIELPDHLQPEGTIIAPLPEEIVQLLDRLGLKPPTEDHP